MKFYYQDAHLTLYHGDCMDLLATLPDKAFDLAIVDPPYGIGFDGHSQIIGKSGLRRGFTGKPLYEEKDWDAERPDSEFFNKIQKVSRYSIIWGGNYFTDFLPVSKSWIFWDKGANSEGLTFSDGELAWSNFLTPLRRTLIPWIGFGMINSGEKKIHPTQKPVALYKWLLQNYAKPGQTILDTHLGSGSIAIACHYAGHHLTAIEKDEDYIKAALERYKRETAQMDMFAPAVEPVIYAQDPLDLPR